MHPSILQLNDALDSLRSRGRDAPQSLDQAGPQGIYLSVDTEECDYTIEASTSDAALFSIKAVTGKPGRWLTLNFDLDKAGFADMALVGFAMRLRAPRSVTLRAAIRTYQSGGHEDVYFPDHIVAHADPGEHRDILWIDSAPSLHPEAEWRTLILFLDPAGCDLTVTDLRFFAA